MVDKFIHGVMSHSLKPAPPLVLHCTIRSHFHVDRKLVMKCLGDCRNISFVSQKDLPFHLPFTSRCCVDIYYHSTMICYATDADVLYTEELLLVKTRSKRLAVLPWIRVGSLTRWLKPCSSESLMSFSAAILLYPFLPFRASWSQLILDVKVAIDHDLMSVYFAAQICNWRRQFINTITLCIFLTSIKTSSDEWFAPFNLDFGPNYFSQMYHWLSWQLVLF